MSRARPPSSSNSAVSNFQSLTLKCIILLHKLEGDPSSCCSYDEQRRRVRPCCVVCRARLRQRPPLLPVRRVTNTENQHPHHRPETSVRTRIYIPISSCVSNRTKYTYITCCGARGLTECFRDLRLSFAPMSGSECGELRNNKRSSNPGPWEEAERKFRSIDVLLFASRRQSFGFEGQNHVNDF